MSKTIYYLIIALEIGYCWQQLAISEGKFYSNGKLWHVMCLFMNSVCTLCSDNSVSCWFKIFVEPCLLELSRT